jgi:hypothetical protein
VRQAFRMTWHTERLLFFFLFLSVSCHKRGQAWLDYLPHYFRRGMQLR